MPAPLTVQKAELQEIRWDDDGKPQPVSDPFRVQFNPETLKVAFANQTSGQDSTGGSSRQYVGTGTTRLTLDLWFDVTAPGTDEEHDDVRYLTENVLLLIAPKKQDGSPTRYLPPGVRFLWGSFLFEGIVDSVNQTLEFFSEHGKPLRANISLAMSKQEIFLKTGDQPSQLPAGATGDSGASSRGRGGSRDSGRNDSRRSDSRGDRRGGTSRGTDRQPVGRLDKPSVR